MNDMQMAVALKFTNKYFDGWNNTKHHSFSWQNDCNYGHNDVVLQFSLEMCPFWYLIMIRMQSLDIIDSEKDTESLPADLFLVTPDKWAS